MRILAAAIAFSVACASSPPPGASVTASSGAPSAPPPPSGAPSAAPSSAASSAVPAPAVVDAALRERLKRDVARVGVEREPGSESWKQIRAQCKDALDQAGFSVELEDVDGRGVNVIGTKRGTKKPEETVILSAHYDHIRGCNGADDNASGVAVVLEAVRAFASKTFDRTVVLAFWDLEEEGFVGSSVYAHRARDRDMVIRLMLSLDGVGFARSDPGSQTLPDAVSTLMPSIAERLAKNEHRANFIAALGDPDTSAFLASFERAGASLGQPAFSVQLSTLARLALLDTGRSDHAAFWLTRYPAALITDTANFRNPNYHCRHGRDDPSTLDYDFLSRVATMVLRTTGEAATVRPTE